MCDSLSLRLQERTSVYMKLCVKRVVPHKNELNLHFNDNLAFYPWHNEDLNWFRKELLKYWPDHNYKPAKVHTLQQTLEELVTPHLGNDGRSVSYKHKSKDPRTKASPFIVKKGEQQYHKGLYGRTISIYQSHGRYYNEDQNSWLWQRAIMFRTIEDMFTQSFVLPYIMPMLENAGAYTITPRERDINPIEHIIDNDPCYNEARSSKERRSGTYSESGSWSNAGSGFADAKQYYTFHDFPFSAGTARMSKCSGNNANSKAVWTADIDSTGYYAVYVSYKSLAKSSHNAHYCIQHRAGVSEYTIDQSRGGGTWIYLGSFEFEKGAKAIVELDNSGSKNCFVSADAVKIGGGIGKIARGPKVHKDKLAVEAELTQETIGKSSGFASAYEGAHYWMQWAGVDTTITQNWHNDYTNDYASRGAWTKMMKQQKGIPVDLSIAFHSSEGVTPGDSLVGTLAIYTLLEDGKRVFEDGRDRITSRLLSDYVQTQIVQDIRANFDDKWSRRGLWDKNYSESRTAGVPTLLLESLSHQNFADMRHGLDPAFRFTLSRAVYKGILKTISAYYGCDYVVQPLPVHKFAARIVSDTVHLSWEASIDHLEPTAKSDAYFVHIRKGDGAFDKCIKTDKPFIDIAVEKGEIYSFQVEAYNEGGKSFPSEILSVGLPKEAVCDNKVLIVNNFDRISAPSWVDTPTWAGFTTDKDSGVPYIRQIYYVGEQFEFDRSVEYLNDYYSGFGACHDDKAGLIVAGNTFDYPSVHGKSLMAAGYAFYSMSREVFCDSEDEEALIDLICGKQATTIIGRGAVPARFSVFPIELQNKLSQCVQNGSSVFISGANIASDCDSTARAFTARTFGYEMLSPQATKSGSVAGMAFSQTLNPHIYCVESPDGLVCKHNKASVWLQYDNTAKAAAIALSCDNYRSIAMGVPFEVILSEDDRNKLMAEIMNYLRYE